MEWPFQRVCATLLASLLLLSAADVSAAATAAAGANSPLCGTQPCLAVAKPIVLSPAPGYRGVAVTGGSGLVLRIPAGYRQIAHNGSVDVYQYPAAGGHKELLLHTTSVSAFGDLGNHGDWRVSGSGRIVTFFRQLGSPAGWNGFVVYRSAKPHGDAMLELYAVGFSGTEFEAMVASIKTKR